MPLVRKAFATVVAVLVAAFVLIQFVRPSLVNPPVTADLQAPPAVAGILRAACYDCHSNEAAVRHARTHAGHEYPAGSMVALATWARHDDPRWFGAKTPGRLLSVEFVTIAAAAHSTYQRFEGASLQRRDDVAPAAADARVRDLLRARAAVMPWHISP